MIKEYNNKDFDKTVLKEIIKAVRDISYGEVVITKHNSKIVQIEKRNKIRF
ncbi:MAG: YezD family protein [bacterium]|nr:YezD family protein [bacterium]